MARRIEYYVEKVQGDIECCPNDQLYESNSVSSAKVEDILIDRNVPERLWDEVVDQLRCPKCDSEIEIWQRVGEGSVLDPFMGSGSTIAAAEAIGYDSIGIELDNEYFKLAERSIPRLAALYPDFTGQELQMNGDYNAVEPENEQQLSMILADKPVSYKSKGVAKQGRNGSRH